MKDVAEWMAVMTVIAIYIMCGIGFIFLAMNNHPVMATILLLVGYSIHIKIGEDK